MSKAQRIEKMGETKEKFTAWITKYALTDGIEKCTAIPAYSEGSIIRTDTIGFIMAPNWYLARAEAINRAIKMRDAKIASHKRLIAKLEKMTFDDTPE